SAETSMIARSDRPMRREISCVRPPILPFTDSRWLRSFVARGSIAYSAVTQPSPDPLRQRGTPSVNDAAHSTRVRPNSTSTLPSAWSSQWRVMVTGRSWSGGRPSARTTDAEVPEESGVVMAPTLATAPGRRARLDGVDGARARDVERAVVDLARLGELALRFVPRRQVREDVAARPRGRRALASPADRE